MANCMIGYPNRIDSAALSGGSWAASLPRANLQSRILGKVARSADATTASTKFDADLGVTKNIRAVAIVNHNCSIDAKWRVRGASDSGFTSVLFDSGWTDVWPAVYPSANLEWEEPNWWSGKYTDEQKTGYTWMAKILASANIVARYWRIEIEDPANAAGYIQIGRAFIGSVWQPSYNMSYGHRMGWETKTAVQEAISGAEYFQHRSPYRIKNLALDNLSTDEGLANAFEIQRRAGIDAEVLWIEDPDDTVHALRRSYLGRLRELSPIVAPHYNASTVAVQIKELL